MLWLIYLTALFEHLTNNFCHSLIMIFIVHLQKKSILDFELCHPYSYCKINKLM